MGSFAVAVWLFLCYAPGNLEPEYTVSLSLSLSVDCECSCVKNSMCNSKQTCAKLYIVLFIAISTAVVAKLLDDFNDIYYTQLYTSADMHMISIAANTSDIACGSVFTVFTF